MNSLLPKEYRITISDDEYYEKMRTETMAVCGACETEYIYENINIFELTVTPFEATITNNKKDKAWICTNNSCKATNRLSQTKIIKAIPESTDHIQIIPKPPTQKAGIRERSKFHKRIRDWIWNAVFEVEERSAQFRDDNWHKANEQMPDEDVDTENDET
jgi:hypothetical protein